MTIASLIEASRLEEGGFRAVVRCIDRRVLKVLGNGRIGLNTRVQRMHAASGDAA